MFKIRSCRAILPAVDLGESLSFYGELGFTGRVLDDDVVEMSDGDVAFYLKAVSPAIRIEAPIMVVTVPSLRNWWIRVKLLDLGRYHRVRPPREPVAEAWGETTGYLYDPSGTTWQFVESRNPADRCRDEYERLPSRDLSRVGKLATVHFDPAHGRFSIL